MGDGVVPVAWSEPPPPPNENGVVVATEPKVDTGLLFGKVDGAMENEFRADRAPENMDALPICVDTSDDDVDGARLVGLTRLDEVPNPKVPKVLPVVLALLPPNTALFDAVLLKGTVELDPNMDVVCCLLSP
jgi:hypothetical protein